MSIATPRPLLERIETFSRESTRGDVWLALSDIRSFHILCNEVAALLTELSDDDVYVLVDATSASEIALLAETCRKSRAVFLFGNTPTPWQEHANIIVCPASQADARFLIALSSTMSAAFVVTRDLDADNDFVVSRGGWTGVRPFAMNIARILLESAECEFPSELPARLTVDAMQKSEACVFRLMSALSHHFVASQRNVSLDKTDLTSVLDILKAISAKRRAHDILYVFVEQIASVVGIDRCSVVRVWGSETQGHVLASHEDENIHDLVIDLAKYPEISKSLETRSKVVVQDVHGDPLTHVFDADFRKAGITAVMVVPIVLFDPNVGSFILRGALRGGRFTQREISFCEIVAEAASNALERAQLFEIIQKANQRLEHLAITDGLTGLFNHRYFRERMQEEFERAIRYRLPLACMLIDVDDFKLVNDRFGHLQGDAVLRELATRTTKAVRKSDIVARYGGEEIVVIMPQTNLEGATHQAKRLHRDVCGHGYDGLPADHKVTLSIGVVVVDHERMKDFEAMVRDADEALYEAKTSGKNRVILQGFGQI